MRDVTGASAEAKVSHGLLHPRLADDDDPNYWGLGCVFSDKQLCALLRGKLLCFGDDHDTQVCPVPINDSYSVIEVREPTW